MRRVEALTTILTHETRRVGLMEASLIPDSNIDSISRNGIVGLVGLDFLKTKNPGVLEVIKRVNNRNDLKSNALEQVHNLLTYRKKRRSGCYCSDKENMDTPGCKSRFCAKKGVKTQISKQSQTSQRAVNKPLMVASLRKTSEVKASRVVVASAKAA